MIKKLKHNKGFKWYSKNNVTIKGYFFFKDDMYADEKMIEVFKDVDNFHIFKKRVNEINGCFAVVVEKNGVIWAATDKSRSIPLYYSSDGEVISDSVDEIINIKKYSEVDYDEVSISELLLSSYIHGKNTAYKEIMQLDLGEAIEISNKVKSEYYYRHLQNPSESSLTNLSQELRKISNNIFERLIKSLDGKTLILPLSGDYDSRYIAAMLKRKNYKRVICYTYGNKDEYEVKYSKMIADILGFEWHFIEYNDALWDELFQDDFIEYCEYYHNYCAIPHIQEFLALRELKRNNILPEDGVVVTGFCGDLPAGSFVLPKKDNFLIGHNKDWVSSYIFNDHYTHFKANSMQKNKIKERIKNYLDGLGLKLGEFDDFMNIYESWFTGARPSKWVVNSNRIYEYFGLEWRMPLWDSEFIEFWQKVENSKRYECKLYKEVLFQWLFKPLKIDFFKPKSIRVLSIEYKKSMIRKFKLIALRFITFIYLTTGLNLYKRNDVNNYSFIALKIFKRISNKRLCGYDQINAHKMMALWWGEEIFGANFIKKIFKQKNLGEIN